MNRISLLCILIVSAFACKSDGKRGNENATVKQVPTEENIESLSKQMFNDSTLQIDRIAALNYIDACESFASANPENMQSVEYLHKAAETARNLETITKALELYDRIIEKYPNHPRASQSLFLKGFTYDNNLQNYPEAKKHYESFLAKYPESDFASSAEFLLANLGKSDEELLETLQKNNAQQ